MTKIRNHILTRIRIANIKSLVIWPIVIGLFFLIGSLLVSEKIYGKSVPDTYVAITGIISAFIFSLSGLFQIYRREGPGIFGKIVKGILPVLVGILWVVFTWICGL